MRLCSPLERRWAGGPYVHALWPRGWWVEIARGERWRVADLYRCEVAGRDGAYGTGAGAYKRGVVVGAGRLADGNRARAGGRSQARIR